MAGNVDISAFLRGLDLTDKRIVRALAGVVAGVPAARRCDGAGGKMLRRMLMETKE
jgi:hypothetical protein